MDTGILVAMVTTVADIPVVSFATMVTKGTNFHRLLYLRDRAKFFRSTDTSYAVLFWPLTLPI